MTIREHQPATTSIHKQGGDESFATTVEGVTGIEFPSVPLVRRDGHGVYVTDLSEQFRAYLGERLIVIDDDIIPGLAVLPDCQFVRIYHDPLHESHAVYAFDLDAGAATPLLDDQHVTLSDAVERAVQHFEETAEFICDRVETRRSVCLDELPSR
ncbi:hypothetical protein [Haloarcula brevis]|uniref:hypothetical protein n=1 Tax=Haloarcula brevis TaxID=3111453 RepID=UPI00300EE18D